MMGGQGLYHLACHILHNCPSLHGVVIHDEHSYQRLERPGSTGFVVHFTVQEAHCLIYGSSPSNT